MPTPRTGQHHTTKGTMVSIIINAVDDNMAIYGDRLATLSRGMQNRVIYRALNREGDKLKTRVIRTLTKQTGLKRKTIVKAVRRQAAYASSLQYILETKGGNIRAKFFSAREGKGGVTAKPRGQSTFYPQAFITSGRRGSRRASPRLGGHVFRNIEGRKWRGKISAVRTDVFIPKEMVIGDTKATFELTSAALMVQIGKQLARVMYG